MPTQIYGLANSWIKQAESQIETYPSGLIKTTGTYIYPGIAPYFVVPNVLNIYPTPVLDFTSDGFTRAVVNSWSVKIIGYKDEEDDAGTPVQSPIYGKHTTASKVIKTGNAIKQYVKKVIVNEGNTDIEKNIIFTETSSFTYLTPLIVTETAAASPATPISPGGNSEVTILSRPPDFLGENVAIVAGWELVSYDSQNYGSVYETKFAYEGSAELRIYPVYP